MSLIIKFNFVFGLVPDVVDLGGQFQDGFGNVFWIFFRGKTANLPDSPGAVLTGIVYRRTQVCGV
jgi:hypothetical protein